MRKTKKQLETEIKELKQDLKDARTQNDALYEKYDNKSERNKIAELYLQTLRVMFNRIGGHFIDADFNRLLDVLEQDRFPEGF